MHCEQSSVGKVSESWAMCPPMEGSRSTSTTGKPLLAMSSAALIPAMPAPTTSAVVLPAAHASCLHGERRSGDLQQPESRRHHLREVRHGKPLRRRPPACA